ncbi:MAG: glycogen-binding domain-containing protein [Gemmatimonadota bacterium]
MRTAFAFVVLTLGAAAYADAQTSLLLDAGVGSTSFASGPGSSMLSMRPAFAWRAGNLRLDLSGGYTSLGPIEWATDASASLSIFTRRWGPLQGELTGGGSGYTAGRLAGAAIGDAGVRLHFRSERQGLWLGAQRVATNAPVADFAFPRFDGGAWGRIGPLTFELRALDGILRVSPDSFPGSIPDTLNIHPSRSTLLSLMDVSMSARWAGRRAELAIAGGGRMGAPTRQRWWQADATYWMSPRLGLVGAIGNYAPSLGSPRGAGSYAMLSLRAAFGPRVARHGSVTTTLVPPGTGLSLQRESPALVGISLRAAGARVVEITGDFSDWRPLSLEAAGGGLWQAAVPMTPGPHQINVRYDGGRWVVPPGASSATDDFGGAVGTILAP